MLRLLHKVCAWLLLGLGAVHTALTPYFMGSLMSARALWFAGAGLAMVYFALVNLLLNKVAGVTDARGRALYLVANLVFLAFGILAVMVVREPQAFLALALISVVTATAFRL